MINEIYANRLNIADKKEQLTGIRLTTLVSTQCK
jgi:hypothetical protein